MKPLHTAVSEDRWTCEKCSRTVVVWASPTDTATALRACQERHGRAHEAARLALQTRRPATNQTRRTR